MRTLLAAALVAGLALMVGSACAEDWRDHPEFRHVCGLPGSGVPVNEFGQFGFGGAYHMNVPCAYTPSKDNYALMYNSASRDSTFRLRLSGHRTDGSAAAMVGFGKPGRGLTATYFVVDEEWVNTINLQYQVREEDDDIPAIAVGILDIFDQRQELAGRNGGARSIYVTATRKILESEKPLYVTLGLGNEKFHGLFGAVSYYPSDRLNVGFEYDGRVARPHVAYNLAKSKGEEKAWDASVHVGWSNFDRPIWGLNATYRP